MNLMNVESRLEKTITLESDFLLLLDEERKKEMTVKELKEFIEEIPDDILVHVIFRGIIDQQPSLNVDEKVLYVEGM